MSNYIHLFETQAAHDAVYNGSGYTEPWVGLVTANNALSYNMSSMLKTMPLTFNILTSGNIIWKATSDDGIRTIEYKKNNGDWTEITSTTSGVSLNVTSGDIVQFKGNNAAYSDDSWNYSSFSGTSSFELKGNILSLINGSNFNTLTTLTESNAFAFSRLFNNCSSLVDASKTVFPATTLASDCYAHMFSNCTNLVNSPSIFPATTLATGCYQYMFENCTSLISVPILPATILAATCYGGMFMGCTAITSTPDLPATTIADNCYSQMFNGCTNLITIPVTLPATTLANSCYWSMFNGCTSLTTAPVLPATTLGDSCYKNMFYGCTNLTTAPDLPAQTLTSSCYNAMFRNCSKLSSIKCLATNISATSCLSNWLRNVSSTGTFTKAASMTSWPSGYNGVPSGWTVQNAS